MDGKEIPMHVVNAAVLERWNTLSDEQVVALAE
jgi:hypothetical protein